MADKKLSIQKVDSQNVKNVERVRANKVYLPPTDIIETESDIQMVADIPGADQETIDVMIENDLLTIQASLTPQIPEDMSPLYREYSDGDYHRTFTLNQSIEKEKIEAKYKNGVLFLRLPKTEPAKPKQIKVNVG